MKRVAFAVAVAVLGGAVPSISGQGRAERIEVPLTDPSRPVTLDVNLTAAIVNVRAAENRMVIDAGELVYLERQPPDKSRIPGPRPPARDATGLRRLTQQTTLDIEEANNVVTVRGPVGARVDFTARVPVRTSFKLKKTAVGSTLGTVTVQGLDGDLEIHTEGGAVTLIDVSGSVVAHSSNSSVVATVKRVTPGRPMSFTSYSGNVDVTLPRSVKATFLLQSDRGDVYTDFDVQTSGGTSTAERQPGSVFRRSRGQPLRVDVNGGGPEFELRTFTGNVYLRRGN